MATGVEVLRAVAAAKFFSNMCKGFTDAEGTVVLISSELEAFRDSADVT
jgi:hypothetical protein